MNELSRILEFAEGRFQGSSFYRGPGVWVAFLENSLSRPWKWESHIAGGHLVEVRFFIFCLLICRYFTCSVLWAQCYFHLLLSLPSQSTAYSDYFQFPTSSIFISSRFLLSIWTTVPEFLFHVYTLGSSKSLIVDPISEIRKWLQKL